MQSKNKIRHSRLCGDPSYLMRRCCIDCHSRILETWPVTVDGIKLYACASCKALKKTTIRQVEDWHLMHATDSAKFHESKVPGPVLHGYSVREERRRSPIVQAWWDFSRGDAFKGSEIYRAVRRLCTKAVLAYLDDQIVLAAKASLVKALSCDDEAAAEHVKTIAGLCCDMMRRNVDNKPGIKYSKLCKAVGVPESAFKESRPFNKDEFGYRMKPVYQYPLRRLCTDIQRVIQEFEDKL